MNKMFVLITESVCRPDLAYLQREGVDVYNVETAQRQRPAPSLLRRASAVQPAPVALIVASRLRLFACLLVHPPSPASCYACGCGCLRFVWDALAAVDGSRLRDLL